MSAPAGLAYPVRVTEIAVKSGHFVEKGTLLVRLTDRDGNHKSIKAPFDCNVEALLCTQGATLDRAGPLFDLREGRAPGEEDIEADLSEVPDTTANRQAAPVKTGAPVRPGPEKPAWAHPSPTSAAHRAETPKPKGPAIGTRAFSRASGSGSRSGGATTSQLPKRMLVTALYLLAAPVLLYLIYDLFDLFPDRELETGRRPGIIFILSHPTLILTCVGCAVMPFLVFSYLGQSFRQDRWSKPFLVLNIAAIAGSILLAAPMPFIPKADYLDFLSHLGLPTDAGTLPATAQKTPSKAWKLGVSDDVLKAAGQVLSAPETPAGPDDTYLVQIRNDCPHRIRIWVEAAEADYDYGTFGPMQIAGKATEPFVFEGEVVKQNVDRKMGIYAEIIGMDMAWKIPKKGSSFWLGNRQIKDAAMMAFTPHKMDDDFATYRLACKNL